MAFKFNKGPQVIGDLVSADDPQRNTKIDFGDDRIDFVVSGSVVASITPNQFSASVLVGNGSSLSGISGGGGGGGVSYPLTVSGTSATGTTYNNTVSKIIFDNNTGFQVSQSAPNEVFLSIGSHYKNIIVQGQPTLSATGSDDLEFKGTGGVSITTSLIDSNTNGILKEVTFSTTDLSSSFSSSLQSLEARQFKASSDGLPYYNTSSIPSILTPPSENRSNYVLGWVNNQLAWVLMSAGISFLTTEYSEVILNEKSAITINENAGITGGSVV